MPYSIRLPDGRVIGNIPDEVTPEQAKQRIISAGLIEQPAPASEQLAAPPATEGGFFPAVKRGFLQTGMLVGDVLPAMVGKAVGAEDYAKRQWEEAAATQERIQREVPAAVPSYKDISSFGDAWMYAKEAVGETVASIIPSLFTGGVGALLSRPAVAAANTAAREAAEAALLSAAAKAGPPTAAAIEAAKKAAVQAGIDAAKKTAFRYEVAGGLAGSALQNIPEVYQNIREETGKEDIPTALLFGGFNAALDTVLPAKLLAKVRGQGLSETEVMAAWYKRGARGLGKGFLIEGATEAAQEASSIAAENFVSDNPDVFNSKNLERVINAGLKGGLGGGAITAATDIATGRAPPKEETDAEKADRLQQEILAELGAVRSAEEEAAAQAQKLAGEQAAAAQRQALMPPSVMDLAKIASGPQGYTELELLKQRILAQPKKDQDPELRAANKDALDAIKDFQSRLTVEEVERRQAPSVPTTMDDAAIRSLGFVPGGPKSVYAQLIGKDISEAVGFLETYAEEKAKPQTKERIDAFLKRIERANIPLSAEAIAKGVGDAGKAVAEPSGAGAPVAGEPGAGAAPTGVGAAEPSGVVPTVPPAGVPPVGEGAPPAPVAPPVAPPAPVAPPPPPAPVAPPVAPPVAAPAPVAPPAPLIALPPSLANITPANRSLYNLEQQIEDAKLPMTGIDWDIKDSIGPNDRGMTFESAVNQLNSYLAGVKDIDGKLRSKNKTGATVKQLIEMWKNASQTQAFIDQEKQQKPELWNAYQKRQQELSEAKVGQKVITPLGDTAAVETKFPKNWRVKLPNGEAKLYAPSALRLLEEKEAAAPAATPAPPLAPAPPTAPVTPPVITTQQLLDMGLTLKQPIVRRLTGKDMGVPAQRDQVIAEINKYLTGKKVPPESRQKLTEFRDQFEAGEKEVKVAPTKPRKPPKTIMGSSLLALVNNRLGGLDLSLLSEFSTRVPTGRRDKNGNPLMDWRNPLVSGFGKLFRSGGAQDYVEIAEMLEEEGYLEQGSVERDYKEAGERAKTLINTALNKDEALTIAENIDQQVAAAQASARLEDEERREENRLLATGELQQDEEFDLTSKEFDQNLAIERELQYEIERGGLEPADLRFLTDEELEQELTDAERQQAEERRAAKAAQAAAQPEAAPAAPGEDAALELTQPTPEELRAREERAEQERKREAAEKRAEQERARREQESKEDKQRADQTVEDFQLGQTAEEQMVGKGLFDAPNTTEALSEPDGPKKAEEVSEAVVQDALEQANLTQEETARLESAYRSKVGTKPFLDRLVKDVQKYITRGAQSVAKNLRDSIGKIVKAVLGIAVVFNVSTAFPINQIYAKPQVPAIDVVAAEQSFYSRLDLNGRTLSPNALRVANWIANQNKPQDISLILDPKSGRLYVMKGEKIISDAPALFGKAGVTEVNDRILQMSIDRLEDADKVTPAGKFPLKLEQDATYGTSITFFPATTGSYAIHRVYLGDPSERRAERLSNSTPSDNNISYGCVNVGNEFYDKVLAKLDYSGNAYGYMLPSNPAQLEKFFPKVPKYSLTSIAEGPTPARIKIPESTQAKIDELESILKRMMTKFGLKDVALNLVQDLEANGEYSDRLIKLALNSERPVRDLRHESLHALKELGFFSDSQWAALEKQARDKWIDKYLKSRVATYKGQEMSRFDAYMRIYKGTYNADGTPNVIPDAVIEEAIADAFGDFDATKAPPGMIQGLLNKMREFFRSLRESLGLANIDTAEDIFRKAEKGGLKAGVQAEVTAPKPSLRTDTPAFKRWSGEAPVIALRQDHVFISGKPVVVEALHGTTNADITEFKKSKANIESDFGAGFYASNTPKDVAINYANVEGADLTRRIETLAERISNNEEFDGDMDAATEEARKRLSQGAPNTMKLYMLFKNPAVLGGKGETFFDYTQSYNEETDEFGEPTGSLVDFVNQLDEVGDGLDVSMADVERAKQDLLVAGQENEGLKLSQLVEIVKDRFSNTYDLNEGNAANGEVLRQALNGMGFDGIIDTNAYAKFGPRMIRGAYSMIKTEGMAGLDKDTIHFVAFNPTQIKSATGNIGTYDPKNPDIRYSLRTETPAFKKWFGGSKIVDKDGKPKVMYHGTAKDYGVIGTARRQAKAIFLTDDPNFAEVFAKDTFARAAANAEDILSPGQIKQAKAEAVAAIRRDCGSSPEAKAMIDGVQGSYRDATAEEREYLRNAYRNYLPAGPNIMPLYVKAENPFDYENRENIAALEQYEKENRYTQKSITNFIGDIKRGDWEAIEDRRVQDAIKSLGYDSFYVKEQGKKSLAVYSSAQLKSATGNIGTFDATSPDIRYSLRDKLGMYSELENKIEAGSNKAPALSWKAYINGLTQKGVKPEEIEWSGVKDWLDLQKGIVTKEELLNYLKQGGVRVEEVVLSDQLKPFAVGRVEGGWAVLDMNANPEAFPNGRVYKGPFEDKQDAIDEMEFYNEDLLEGGVYRGTADASGATKYGQYTLPGGENYREALLTLPNPKAERLRNLELRYNRGDRLTLEERQERHELLRDEGAKGAYQSQHWEQPNVIAHIRVNDRTDADGKRVLFVEEIQSDWGQEGKKKGFHLTPAQIRDLRPGSPEAIAALARGDLGVMRPVVEDGFGRQMTMEIAPEKTLEGIAPAPFVTKTEGWLNLALKRVMVMAAEGGYDRVAFINGEQSAERYDLSKRIDDLRYGDGTLVALQDGRIVLSKEATPAELPDLVGKEVADRLLKAPEMEGNGYRRLSGLDLKVGGEGMKTFYDTIVPTALKKLLPKVGGGQVSEVRIETGDKLKQDEAELDETLIQPARGLNDESGYRTSDGQFFESYGDAAIHQREVSGAVVNVREKPQPGFDVTPAMRDKVQTTGLPRFSLREGPVVRQNIRSQINPAIQKRIEETIAPRDEKTFAKRILDAITPEAFSSFRASALNRYNYLSVVDKKKVEMMGGKDLLADASAESAALLSDLGAGLTASALGVHDRAGGAPVYKHYFVVEVNGRQVGRHNTRNAAQTAADKVNGVVRERGYTTVTNFDNSIKGPVAIFAPLAKYGDPEMYRRFQFYAAVKRGARFMYTVKNGKVVEQLFEPGDIAKAKALEQQYPEFKDIHKNWIAYNDKLVDFMRDTGVISEQNAATFKMHGDYFPFYRQINGEPDAVGPRIFQSIGAVKPPKKLKGSEAALGDFFENIVQNTQAAIQAGVKNIAARRAADLGMDIDMVQKVPPGQVPDAVTSFYVLENGLKQYYTTRDLLFLNAVKSLNLPDMPFIGMLAGPANLLRNLVTKDPGFMLANLLRDSLSAWTTSGVKMVPIADTIANFGRALGSQDKNFQALLNAGIIGGYEFSQNVETSAKEFGGAMRKVAGVPTTREKITKPFTSLWDALEKGTTASDAATRMEIYKKTLAETGNEAEALYRSLEVMNFNRKGSSAVIRVLTAAVPFLNARMQGLDILYRAAIAPSLDKNASDRAKEIQRTFFVRGAMIMALSAMYWAMTHDDEEYKKQEQETRDNYWLFPSLGIKIPIPFEVGVLFKVIPERILGYTMGTDTGEDFLKSMGRQLISTFAFNPIPQTVLPAVEAVTNFSFFTWRPIIPQGLEDVAPQYQIAPGTSKLAEGIAKSLAEIPGLGKTRAASPIIIDQLINGYTGTMGMYAVDLMDAVFNTMTDSPKPSKRFEQMPVFKRFVVDPEARGTVTAYYGLKNSVDEAVRTANLLERTMDYENYGPYMMENMRLLAARDYVLDMEKTLKDIREQKTLIRVSQMSADQKRDALVALNNVENLLTGNIQELKKMFS